MSRTDEYGIAANRIGRGVSAEVFKDALRTVAGPATVVTAFDGHLAHATTVSAFCSLSANPPLILVCLDLKSHLLEVMTSQDQGRFSVHILKPGQEPLALHCATKEPDKLGSTSWKNVGGVPQIEGAGTWLSCEVSQIIPAGDHMVVIGLVTDCSIDNEACLVYRDRSFHSVS